MLELLSPRGQFFSPRVAQGENPDKGGGMTSVTRQDKGQNLVEFALLLPIFLLILVGIAEFGRAWMIKNVMTGAAREDARDASVKLDTTSAFNAAKSMADPILASANIPLTLQPADFHEAAAPVPIVSISITYNYPLTFLNLVSGLFPGLPGPNINLAGTATIRRERY